MNEPPYSMDRIRAWVEGSLEPEELRRLERELAADEELGELAQQFRDVHALTEALGPLPEPSSSFAQLERRLPQATGSRPVARRVAAAAGILLVASVAVIAWRSLGGFAAPGPLQLSAIDLNARLEIESVAVPPAGLAGYDPRSASGGVAWIYDDRAAAWLAEASGRPLLVYGSIRGCPMCVVLERDVFAQAEVLDLVERYVPLRIDLGAIPQDDANALIQRGYPFLEVWSFERETLHSLSRAPVAASFVESMQVGLEAAGARGDMPTWERIRSAAQQLDGARADEEAGLMAEAERGYSALASSAQEAFASLGAAGLRRLLTDVRERFLAAREAAATDPDRALTMLGAALERYRGTRFAPDLEALRRRLEQDGCFPEVLSAF